MQEHKAVVVFTCRYLEASHVSHVDPLEHDIHE
jgi:hypothetical protein